MAHIIFPDRTIDCTIACTLPGRKLSDRVGSTRYARSRTPFRFIFTILGLALLLGAAGTTTADEVVPSDGTIEATYTYTARDLSTVPSSEGRENFVNESFVVLTVDEPAPFRHLGGRCIGAGSSDTTTFAYEMSGSCEYRDVDGDAIFERFEEHSTGDGADTEGQGTLIGGTGKFATLSGDYTYRAKFYASVTSGVYQGAGNKKGKWHMASPE